MNGDQRTQNGKPNNDSGWKQVIDTLEQTLREFARTTSEYFKHIL
jgi:hypothetical protein